ncbi:MAG: cysteine hydrolase [Erysipelothrix sp.]|nr:cysteine hydrolase [Erysipelothrix sp.]
MSNTALIIIDMQVGLLEDDNYPIFNKELLISNINALISKARNAGVTVIFVRHTESFGSPLEINQPGWQISTRLNILSDDIIIDKYTPDCFHQTTLMDILKKQNISKLVITGLQTEYCIDTTCRRSFTLGYDTVLISDAHSTCDSPLLSAEKIINHHNQVLSNVFVTLHDHGYNDFK